MLNKKYMKEKKKKEKTDNTVTKSQLNNNFKIIHST